MNVVSKFNEFDRVAKDGLSASEAKVQSIPPVWFDGSNNTYYTYDKNDGIIYSHKGDWGSAKRALIQMGIESKKATKMVNTCPDLKLKFKPTTLEKLFDGKYVNAFEPTKYMLMEPPTEPVEIPKFFKRVLDNVFPDPRDQDYYLNWVAYIFQRREKTRVALIIRSIVHGTGRGLVSREFLEPLFGDAYKGGVSDKDLSSRWGNYIENKLIVQMDDISLLNKSSKCMVANKVKNYIGESTILMEARWKNWYDVDNYSNIIINTSHNAPIEVDLGDMYYRTFVTSNVPLDKFDWFNEVRNNEGIKARIGADMEQWAKFLHGYKVDVSKLYGDIDNAAKPPVVNLTTDTVTIMVDTLAKRSYEALLDIGFDESSFKGFDDIEDLKKCVESGRIPNPVIVDIYNSLFDGEAMNSMVLGRKLSGHSKCKSATNVPYIGKYERGWVFFE